MKMRRICFFALFLLSLMAGKSQVQVRTGDLLFVGLPLDYTLTDDTTMSGAISAATGNKNEVNYIHVAILEVDEQGALWIVDATLKHGVDRHPMDTFLADFTLKNGDYPQLDVMRLKQSRHVAQYVANTKKFCGEAYDLYFLPGNDRHYCTELVYDSYITPKGKHLFHAGPMNFKDEEGEFPPYWVQLFQLIGQPIPQGEPGTNPNAMSKEKCLKRVGTLEVK